MEEPPLSEQELKLVMRESHEEGVITENEAQIINRAFEFSDKRATDIMVPTDKVDMLSFSRTAEENLAIIRKHMHTRFPLCRSDFQTVMGLVHMKDAWSFLLEGISNEAFEKCSRPIIFVEPWRRQDQLMRIFQSRRGHMAVVRDTKTHRNLGIVTMEDVLEELVGDIRDEHGN